MKRIGNVILGFFKAVIRFFDRWLITPITKLCMAIYDFFRNNGKGLEKILSHRQALVVTSLMFALVTFYAIDQKHVTLIDSSAEVLYGQKVTADYNEALYVVEGIPDEVDITLVGRRSDVYLAKQYPINGVMLDLNGLGTGTHNVSFKYEQAVSSVKYKVDPSNINVTIYDKISETRELSVDIIHKDNLDTKLNIESTVLDRDNVIIKGAKHQLSKVAIIKAVIDVDNLSSTKVGSTTLSNVPLIAYDQDGNKVDVEIVPATVEATVKITSPSKSVPVRLIVEGELDGKAIKSLTSTTNSVMIYGSETALEGIEYLPVTVDVTGVSTDKEYNINLVKPSGVREISVKTINVKLAVDEIVSKDVEGIKITPINLESDLKVQALTESDSVVTVIVNGSETVIESFDPSSIKANIDLAGLGVGEHEVEIIVSGTDSRLTYTPRVRKVKVKISK